jgi:hypothetical protein
MRIWKTSWFAQRAGKKALTKIWDLDSDCIRQCGTPKPLILYHFDRVFSHWSQSTLNWTPHTFCHGSQDTLNSVPKKSLKFAKNIYYNSFSITERANQLLMPLPFTSVPFWTSLRAMTPPKLNRTLIFNQRSALGSAYSHNCSIVVKTITVANVATVGDDQRSHNLRSGKDGFSYGRWDTKLILCATFDTRGKVCPLLPSSDPISFHKVERHDGKYC